MAEPFVFCFRPGAHGHPEQMYIHDVLCGCGVCGHPQIQRFYHAMSYHTLTLERLQELVVRSHEVAGYECEHCGSQVGPHDVRTGVIRFAFADDSGEVVAYVNDFGMIDGPTVAMQLFAGRRLDPQVQPRFEPEPDVPCVDVLTHAVIEEVLGRPVSFKRELRRMMGEWEHSEDVEEGLVLVERLAPGFWAVVGDAHEDLVGESLEAHDELAKIDEQGELTWCLISESEPYDLVTHAHPAQISGRWIRWAPNELLEVMEAGELEVWCGLSHTHAEHVLTRAFDIARLGYERELDEHGLPVLTHICSPRDEPYGHDVSVWSILERAAYTGISAGDAARLTAEEVVGVMLKVWKIAAKPPSAKTPDPGA